MSKEIISVEPFPTHQQEVERKAWETFYHLTHRNEIGEITDIEYKAGIDTLHMALTGLVDTEFTRLLSEVRDTLKEKASEIQMFHRPYIDETLVIAVRKPNQAKVEVLTIGPGKPAVVRHRSFADEDEPDLEALKYFNNFKTKALQSGFELF